MAWSTDEALSYLRQAWESQRLAHAYLITGPSTRLLETLALGLLRLVNGIEATSLTEIKHASTTLIQPLGRIRTISIDAIREFEATLQFSPDSSAWRAGILFEADRLTHGAANAFLKTLEEPPPQTLLLLLSEHPEKLIPTVVSRCVPVALRPDPADHETLTDTERRLLDCVVHRFLEGGPGVVAAFGLARDFSALVQESLETVTAQFEKQLAEETAVYGKTTDGSWLKDRKEFLEQAARSEYLRRRSRHLELILTFLGDALRSHWTPDRHELPDYRESAAALAAHHSPADLVSRLEAMATVRDQLSTTALEGLILEAGFLRAFG
ncbi:MAG TPA: hypothetical protein VMN36_06940 [Verrucomicrobiales bacterium]|nr:hypothetical protein [Verrucomicrobiales bacterium]